MSYYCDKYPIIEKKSISRDTFSITIYAPEAAKAAHASLPTSPRRDSPCAAPYPSASSAVPGER